jgi:hypothetical protein
MITTITRDYCLIDLQCWNERTEEQKYSPSEKRITVLKFVRSRQPGILVVFSLATLVYINEYKAHACSRIVIKTQRFDTLV